jgi:hypothetical protein
MKPPIPGGDADSFSAPFRVDKRREFENSDDPDKFFTSGNHPVTPAL